MSVRFSDWQHHNDSDPISVWINWHLRCRFFFSRNSNSERSKASKFQPKSLFLTNKAVKSIQSIYLFMYFFTKRRKKLRRKEDLFNKRASWCWKKGISAFWKVDHIWRQQCRPPTSFSPHCSSFPALLPAMSKFGATRLRPVLRQQWRHSSAFCEQNVCI